MAAFVHTDAPIYSLRGLRNCNTCATLWSRIRCRRSKCHSNYISIFTASSVDGTSVSVHREFNDIRPIKHRHIVYRYSFRRTGFESNRDRSTYVSEGEYDDWPLAIKLGGKPLNRPPTFLSRPNPRMTLKVGSKDQTESLNITNGHLYKMSSNWQRVQGLDSNTQLAYKVFHDKGKLATPCRRMGEWRYNYTHS